MSEVGENRPRTVCVTGAAGFVGSHVTKALLAHGCRVRATVRDAGDRQRTAHLLHLSESAEHPLELFSAELTEPRSFDEAVAGCETVFHVASVVRLSAKDPRREIVEPAVEGTRNVLASVRRAGTAKRVVLTSSVAAVLELERKRDHVYTEADWNESSTLRAEPYPLSKALAERAAWDFVGALGEEERFDLIALNPGFVFGPLLAPFQYRSSPVLLRDLFTGRMPACPRIFMGIVDVRDVADAHVRAMERPEASGRYILWNEGLWMQEIGQRLSRLYPGRKIPTRRLPNALVYLGALMDKRLSVGWAWRNLGRRFHVDNGKAIRELGLSYRPLDETLADTCSSLVEHGKA